MGRKRLAAEQIVTKLRQIEVLKGQGKTIAVACGAFHWNCGQPSPPQSVAFPSQLGTKIIRGRVCDCEIPRSGLIN
jgi:hypothetical protein